MNKQWVTWTGLRKAFWKLAWIFPTILAVGLWLGSEDDHTKATALAAGSTPSGGDLSTFVPGSRAQPAVTPTPVPLSATNVERALLAVSDLPFGWQAQAEGGSSPAVDPPLYCGSPKAALQQPSDKVSSGLLSDVQTSFQMGRVFFGERLRGFSDGADSAWDATLSQLRSCRMFTRTPTCPAVSAGTPTPSATSTWNMSELSIGVQSPDVAGFRIWSADKECGFLYSIEFVLIKRASMIQEYYYINPPVATLSPDANVGRGIIPLMTTGDRKLITAFQLKDSVITPK